MALIEREDLLNVLTEKFSSISQADGHCILISGESGIGKTSLIKEFSKILNNESRLYIGRCDSLFTPRPLAPIYDIALQMGSDIWEENDYEGDRARLFNKFLNNIINHEVPVVIVFEDIHWADEATLDFIKFLARRISNLHCLFVLTYRDNEVHAHHPLKNVLGELSADTVTRVQIPPLSRQAVENLANKKGFDGADVYKITGGNPFYVSEILASYSDGIPQNVSDSILSVYNHLNNDAKKVWQILSVAPSSFEIKYLKKILPFFATAIESCLDRRILIMEEGKIYFKHELFRRTVEASLSSFMKSALNKRILELLLKCFEKDNEIERIIHYAKNANENDLIVKYAPLAAKKAAHLGSHFESCKLYLLSIKNYQGNDYRLINQLYESYAYECYLTNQIVEAIIYMEKLLFSWTEKKKNEEIGNCLRFLSRLWWFNGSKFKAELYAHQSIKVLENEPASRVKAMSYSNMSQLKMLSGEFDECIFWGQKAINMAFNLSDDEILCHALNNIGSVQMGQLITNQKGLDLLKQSLEIALKNAYDEHASRAYINLVNGAVRTWNFEVATKYIDLGSQYCRERDIEMGTTYLLLCRAWLDLETGHWDNALLVTEKLLQNANLPIIIRIGALIVFSTVKMRRGEKNVEHLLIEAKEKAFDTCEIQRVVPSIVALLEYEWITGIEIIENRDIDSVIEEVNKGGKSFDCSEFFYWLFKTRKRQLQLNEIFEGYKSAKKSDVIKASTFWESIGCTYKQALLLFNGNEIDKRKAMTIVQKLGADAIFEKMKEEMKASGVKRIPRGIRKTTKSNMAFLTIRELNVLQLIKEELKNREIAERLYISPKTVDHHVSSILFKLDVRSRLSAIQKATDLGIVK